MTVVYPQSQTIAVVVAFLVVYLAYLLRRAVQHRIDLYDFFLLSTVAIFPAGFVLFPELAFQGSHVMGVEFPFILLLSGLILILFFVCLSLILRLNRMKRDLTKIAQEVGLRTSSQRPLD